VKIVEKGERSALTRVKLARVHTHVQRLGMWWNVNPAKRGTTLMEIELPRLIHPPPTTMFK